jgi:transcriptional regulator with XRE-family HTH domain
MVRTAEGKTRPARRPAPWRRDGDGGQLGRKIQLVRERRGLSLSEASRLTSVAGSTLSKIENGRMSPTFDVVTRIMRGLQISPAFLFRRTGATAQHPPVAVDRRKEAIVISIPGADYEILCADNVAKDLFPSVVTLRARSHHEPVAHTGEEFVMVLDGTLEVSFKGGASHRLARDECLHFDSTLPHSFRALGGRPVRFLAVSNRAALEGEDFQDAGSPAAQRLRQLVLQQVPRRAARTAPRRVVSDRKVR